MAKNSKKEKGVLWKKTIGADQPPPKVLRSSSSSKVKDVEMETSATSNRIIDVSILLTKLEEVVCCNACHGNLKFSEIDSRGLAFKIAIICKECQKNTIVNSCHLVGSQANGYEVNKRSVLALRALGKGHAGLSTFCGLIDLPQPVLHSNYDNINKILSNACETVAENSMMEAVTEEFTKTANDNLIVSGDGSWRRRGFSSLQGISSVIGLNTGKVIDVSIKSSFCRACSQWEGKEETSAYEEWFEIHKSVCSCNHEGSTGKMEVDGMIEIFKRSEKKYQVRYTGYIGDGDSKTFQAIAEVKPYNDCAVEKKECVGHVQKR